MHQIKKEKISKDTADLKELRCEEKNAVSFGDYLKKRKRRREAYR